MTATHPAQSTPSSAGPQRRIWLRRAALLALTVFVVLAMFKGIRIYTLVQGIRQNARAIKAVELDPAQHDPLTHIDPLVWETQAMALDLHAELAPVVTAAQRLTWLPIVGHDLAASDELLQIYRLSVDSVIEVYQGASAFAGLDNAEPSALRAAATTFCEHSLLAHSDIADIRQLRASIEDRKLTPITRRILEQKLDNHLALLYMLDELLALSQAGLNIVEVALPYLDQPGALLDDPEPLLAFIDQAAIDVSSLREHVDAVQALRESLAVEQLIAPLDELVIDVLDPHLDLLDLAATGAELASSYVNAFASLASHRHILDQPRQADPEQLLAALNSVSIEQRDLANWQEQQEALLDQRAALDIEALHPALAERVTSDLDPQLPLLSVALEFAQFWRALDESATPVLTATDNGGGLDGLSTALTGAEPQLVAASAAYDELLAALASLDTASLHPQLRTILDQQVAPRLPRITPLMHALPALPRALALGAHPETHYLVLLQNEDELRATGGFITSVALIAVQDGRPTEIIVTSSADVDVEDGRYASVPWQLREYMGLELWVLRDANWSPDFPVVADYVRGTYRYFDDTPLDGVIALNQEAIRQVLAVTGPIRVDGEIVDADNLIDYLRTSKTTSLTGLGLSDDEWLDVRKDFLQDVGEALIDTLQSDDIDLVAFALALTDTLDERHILLDLSDPALAALAAAHRWDGRLERGLAADYLSIVESNVGYNKVNPVIVSTFEYDVDLTDPAQPTARLTITDHNQAAVNNPCDPGPALERYHYENLVNQCYWNYLRVFTRPDTQLVNGVAQDIPPYLMFLGNGVSAHFDELTAVDGGGGFGTLLLVETQDEATVQLELKLPPTTLVTNPDGTLTYSLYIQKQAGVLALNGLVRVLLPEGHTVIHTAPEAVSVSNAVEITVASRTDFIMSITLQANVDD